MKVYLTGRCSEELLNRVRKKLDILGWEYEDCTVQDEEAWEDLNSIEQQRQPAIKCRIRVLTHCDYIINLHEGGGSTYPVILKAEYDVADAMGIQKLRNDDLNVLIVEGIISGKVEVFRDGRKIE